jgi:hypothetical protein
VVASLHPQPIPQIPLVYWGFGLAHNAGRNSASIEAQNPIPALPSNIHCALTMWLNLCEAHSGGGTALMYVD